ncbi:uncharacterized protein A4U43_C05F21390 [Asparagus officinalis]|uniref:Uncharacterized protein n=1 Tax=Asparagus officinalis TaxID=4686 RepID=A0A5P1ETC4_ASPOF|nr:uncharacterized protein A4U43_C05F21390 [Asparagus officinalis]
MRANNPLSPQGLASGLGLHVSRMTHLSRPVSPHLEDVAIADGIPEFLRRSILLQTFGVTSPHVCQEAEHVLIPPYIPPGILRSPPPKTARRDIFVFFRGKMEVHPKNISGRFCSK